MIEKRSNRRKKESISGLFVAVDWLSCEHFEDTDISSIFELKKATRTKAIPALCDLLYVLENTMQNI